MTKRISQVNTVVVPAVHADGVDGKVVAAKSVVVPAEAEVASVKVEAKADEVVTTVVAEPVAALVAPAPMAMVTEPVAAEPAAAASASAAQGNDDGGTDLTPYIVGGVLILGGVLAVALSSGDTDPIPVTPAPANTAPNFTSALTATVAENAAVATIVYDANASDTQGNAIVFTIGGTDAALFNIDASTGVVTLRASANFEAKPTYSFTVTATDNGTPALSATQTVTVSVTNVNEAPTFASATATATTPENVPTTTVVFQAAATDPDAVGQVSPFPAGSVVSGYTLGGPDAALFTVSSTGAVTFRASPDFETPRSAAGTNTYTFTIVATDNAATPLSSTAQTVTLTVTDVAEGPVFTSAATATVAENAAVATVVFDANATGATSFALGGADAAAFNFDTATGIATLRTSADFETKPTYNVTVTATGPGGTSTQAVVVNVTNVNEAPFFTASRSLTVAENVAAGTALYTTGGAADVDAGATITYSLTGPDAASFTVNATTGAVSFVASPNFEAKPSYSFNLVATDQAGLTATQLNTVTVTNVNEAPAFAAASQAVSFAENGTGAVLTAAAVDPDAGAVVSYTLTGADAALFNVSSTGVVTFRAAPNFEATPTKTSFAFNIVATDQGGLSATQAATVTLTNVNEAPAFAVATRSVAIDENVAVGTVVPGSAVATDPDANAVLTYSLSGADAARFTINATTGVVALAVSPDFETKPVYNFNVVATDQGGLAATQAVTLNINDLPEGVRIDGGTIPAGTNTSFSAAVGNVTFLESASAGNITTISNFTVGDIIQTDAATSSYSFGSLGNDLVISVLNNGVSSQITLTGAAGNNFIFNEASAEQAVGFDFFRTSAAAPPAAANTLAGTTSYNAANAAVTYTDDATSPNVSTITNFTSDDRIVATNANGGTYSFGSNGSDLVISFLSNGVSSQITLVGAANPNVFVFNEATAEQAVGFDFFRYG